MWFLHWCYVHFGITGSGSYYGWWSGAGSDLGEVAIIGGVVTLVRHHNCHVKGCKRIGRHKVEGTPYVTCKQHHPTTPAGDITVEHVRAAHDAHRAGLGSH